MLLFAQTDIVVPIATAAITALGVVLVAVIPVWLKLRHERMMRELDKKETQIEQESLDTGANQLENQLVSTLTRLKELEAKVSQLESKLSVSVGLDRESRKRPAQLSKDYFLTTKKGAYAKGGVVEGGFLVYKDSSINFDTAPKCPTSISKERAQLLEDGVLVRQGEQIKFATNHRFTSPSRAAGVVSGGSANGLLLWKDADGRSLGDDDPSVDKAG